LKRFILLREKAAKKCSRLRRTAQHLKAYSHILVRFRYWRQILHLRRGERNPDPPRMKSFSTLIAQLYFAQLKTRMLLDRGRFILCRRPASVSPTTPVLPASLSRILFVVKGLLGDATMCLPVLSGARELWPSADLLVLGTPQVCELLSAFPHLTGMIMVSVNPYSISGRRELLELKKRLIDGRFDAAIILLGDDFAKLLADARIPIRVGVKGTMLDPCLTHLYSCAKPRTWGPKDRLNALRVLGFDVPDRPPTLSASDSGRRSSSAKLASAGLKPGTRYVLIHPFGSQRRQWWNLEQLETLASAIKEKAGLPSVMVGGALGKSPTEGKAWPGLFDLTGNLNLSELLAIIESAEAVITTDSGPFHMAGALQRPIVGLFRASRPEHASRYGARSILGSHPSCSGKCRWDSCRHSPCREMLSITVSQIVEKLCP
jgi:heptosyltransferase I